MSVTNMNNQTQGEKRPSGHAYRTVGQSSHDGVARSLLRRRQMDDGQQRQQSARPLHRWGSFLFLPRFEIEIRSRNLQKDRPPA